MGLLIKECKGYELVKEKATSPEEFFNRSEVTFLENGIEKTLHVLYVKFFEESFNQFVPYETEPLFTAGTREIYFKDLVALIFLLHHPDHKQRKRIYISSQVELTKYFKDVDFSKIEMIFQGLEKDNSYYIGA